MKSWTSIFYTALICLFGTFSTVSVASANTGTADFYWKGMALRVGTLPINENYFRDSRPPNVSSSCPDDHPHRDAGLCYKQCTDRKGDDKKKYDYDFKAGTCWRKSEFALGSGTPKSYPAESRPISVSVSCPSGFATYTGVSCLKDCSDGYRQGDVPTFCSNVRNGQCPNDRSKGDLGLCYTPCPSGMSGTGAVCVSGTPKGYLPCGAGFSKSTESCALTIADQVLTANTVAFATAGNLIAAKAQKIPKFGKILAKSDPKLAEELIKSAPMLAKLAENLTPEAAWLASKLGKGEALSPQELNRLRAIMDAAVVEIRASNLFEYMGLNVVPTAVDFAQGGLTKDQYRLHLDGLFAYTRLVAGFMAFALDMSNPVPGVPWTQASAFLDVIASYGYTVYYD